MLLLTQGPWRMSWGSVQVRPVLTCPASAGSVPLPQMMCRLRACLSHWPAPCPFCVCGRSGACTLFILNLSRGNVNVEMTEITVGPVPSPSLALREGLALLVAALPVPSPFCLFSFVGACVKQSQVSFHVILGFFNDRGDC